MSNVFSSTIGVSFRCLPGLLGLALLPSCRMLSPAPNPNPPARAHAIHSRSLEDLMVEVHQQAVGQLSEDLEAAQNQRGHYPKVADAARKLERSAHELENYTPHLRLSQSEQDRFMMLAEKLASYSSQLTSYSQSRNPKPDLMEGYYDKIMRVCNECHGAFRVLPELPAQRHASR